MRVDLSKHPVVELKKEDGTAISRLFIGINWNQNTYAGEADFDLDLGAFVSGFDKQITDVADIINYAFGKKHPSGVVEYTGDNRNGNDNDGVSYLGHHYDEAMYVDTSKFPADKDMISLYATIYLAHKRNQNFGLVSNASVEVIDMDDSGNSFHFDLSNDPKYTALTALVLLEIKKVGSGFTLQKVARGFAGGTKELYANFGLEIKGDDY